MAVSGGGSVSPKGLRCGLCSRDLRGQQAVRVSGTLICSYCHGAPVDRVRSQEHPGLGYLSGPLEGGLKTAVTHSLGDPTFNPKARYALLAVPVVAFVIKILLGL